MSNFRLENVVVMFPKVFTPQAREQGEDPKFSATFFLPAGHPQIDQVNKIVETAKANAFPSGFPAKSHCAVRTYDEVFSDSKYYNPDMSGGVVIGTSAREDDRPEVVDLQMQKALPNMVWAGCLVNAFIGITGYTKGKGGIGGWLNGVQTHEVDGPYGRFDGKPNVEQMFGAASSTPAAQTTTPKAPPAPNAPKAPPAPAAKQMSAKAQEEGQTYESLSDAGWTEDQMVEHGYLVSATASTSFE